MLPLGMSIIFFLLGVQDIVCFSAASASFLISVAVPCETPMALHLTLRGHEDKQRFMLFLLISHIYIYFTAFDPRVCSQTLWGLQPPHRVTRGPSNVPENGHVRSDRLQFHQLWVAKTPPGSVPLWRSENSTSAAARPWFCRRRT